MREIAARFGTPLYVYDAELIRDRARELKRHFAGAIFHYAMKANANPAILTLLKKEGFGVEAVSPGELARASQLGFKRKDISFTCASLTEEELVYAAEQAGRVHLDSLRQLEVWGRRGLGPTVSLRLNQGIGGGHHTHVVTGGPDSKFGITLADLPRAHERAREYGVQITSIQQHIGSNVLDEAVFMRAVRALLKIARSFPDLEHVDFGGGLGVPYAPSEKRLNLKRIGAIWKKESKALGPDISYAFEPGRYLVAESGSLLVTVVDRKETSSHTFVGVNAGMNLLLRPALYGAYHAIDNLTRTRGKKGSVTIAGNICESGDLLAVDRAMTIPELGDTLAIRNAGAYGASMASGYNLRPLPMEVLVDRGRARVIAGPG